MRVVGWVGMGMMACPYDEMMILDKPYHVVE